MSTAAPRLSPGDRAPDFTLPTAGGSMLALADLAGSRAVLYFYPAAGTPGCAVQADDFQASLPAFSAAGWRVVGVSPDPPDRLAAVAAAQGLTFPLLSDADRTVLAAYGAYGEKTLYGKKVTGVIRSTVTVDADGTVLSAAYNVRAKGHVAKLARELGLDVPG